MRNISSHAFTRTAIFTTVLIFVGGVSAYDGYLVIRTGEVIRDFKKNPVGRYLIDCNDGDPSFFLRVKAAGTIVALTALAVLRKRSRRLAGPVTVGLVFCQSGLLIFLEHC
jgi:hypothetical protein